MASTPDGKQICVTHAGTHELSVIDAPGLSEKLAKFGNLPSPSAANVPNDLAFLGDLRRRVKLEGNGPHGVAIIGSNAYVAEYFSDAVAIVDLRANPPRTAGRFLLGPKPTIDAKRRGEMLFNDATISFQHWQSCASCHPDGRTDGLYWDLPNDGLGNPKKARSLVGAFARGAAMSLGVRASAGEAVRAGLRYVMMAARPEEDAEAIDEYIRSLTPVPSPRLIDGKLSPAAERGEKIFFDRRVGCTRCHPAPQFTDKRAHDVGTPALWITRATGFRRRRWSSSGAPPPTCTTVATAPSRRSSLRTSTAPSTAVSAVSRIATSTTWWNSSCRYSRDQLSAYSLAISKVQHGSPLRRHATRRTCRPTIAVIISWSMRQTTCRLSATLAKGQLRR